MLLTSDEELKAASNDMASPLSGHDFSLIPYILPQQERYRPNWRSTSQETDMNRKQTASLNKLCACL